MATNDDQVVKFQQFVHLLIEPVSKWSLAAWLAGHLIID
jgi:hypothetical protein